MKTLLAKFLGLTQSVLAFYTPLLRQLVVSGTSALLPLALEIVRSLAETDKSGTQKRSEAIKSLRRAAKVQGITATESLIRFTIESAVQRLKLNE
jgi:hypothetical protein